MDCYFVSRSLEDTLQFQTVENIAVAIRSAESSSGVRSIYKEVGSDTIIVTASKLIRREGHGI